MAINSEMNELIQGSMRGELEDAYDSTLVYTQAVDQPRIQRAVREILQAVGENPDREGLRDTPARVARMYAELFGGLHVDPRQHLRKFFSETCVERRRVRDMKAVAPQIPRSPQRALPPDVAYLPRE